MVEQRLAGTAGELPSFGASAYQTIDSRLRDTQTRVMEMSVEQVEQRISHASCDPCSSRAGRPGTASRSTSPITRQDIAEMMGTTLHTGSRLLSAWEDEGLVRAAGRR